MTLLLNLLKSIFYFQTASISCQDVSSRQGVELLHLGGLVSSMLYRLLLLLALLLLLLLLLGHLLLGPGQDAGGQTRAELWAQEVAMSQVLFTVHCSLLTVHCTVHSANISRPGRSRELVAAIQTSF